MDSLSPANTIHTQLDQLIASGRTVVSTFELVQLLEIKSQTAYKWACYENGPIHPIRIGKTLRWRVSDIATLIQGGK